MADIESLIRDFRQEYRDGRKELLDALGRLDDKLQAHSRDDDERFDRLDRDLREIIEQRARDEGRREGAESTWAVATGRHPAIQIEASVSPSRSSWIPDAIRVLRRLLPYIATALGAGSGWELLRRLFGAH
jgi:hypothetical protein